MCATAMEILFRMDPRYVNVALYPLSTNQTQRMQQTVYDPQVSQVSQATLVCSIIA